MFSRLTVLGIGALAMYFLDPVSGAKRRAQLRDKYDHYRGEGLKYAEDFKHKAEGYVAEAKGAVEKKLGRQRGGSSSVDIDLTQ